jgi:hypothetical protein
MPFNVFEESPKRSNCADVPLNMRPKVSRVFFPFPFPRRTEGLAGIPGSDAVYLSVKCCAWEGFNVRPDRERSHHTLFNRSRQVEGGEGFDLHSSDCAKVWDNSLKSHVEHSPSGTKADNSLFGIIHTAS